MNFPIQTLFVSTVFAVIIWVPNFASGSLRGPASVPAPIELGLKSLEPIGAPKTFAVFVVSSGSSGDAIGGVAGTAFFISTHEAVTAYHVLQPKSFEVPDGFTRRQVWLVHENHPAIELKASNVRFDAANDLARIRLDTPLPLRFVYESASSYARGKRVSTDGFRANSAGPVLAHSRNGIVITSVPRLDRVHLQGELVQHSRIDLRATDVTLVNTPCLQVSYPPIRGISGGPLLVDGRVVGVNSFGDPREDSRTWAIDLKLTGS